MRSRYRRTGLRLAAVAAAATLGTAGCSMQEVKRGWMPGEPGITDHTDMITNLWVGSWIAALAVGALTWGLIIWCVAAYRRRKTDTGFPEQLRYHVPLEIMYTIIPFMMIAVLFYFTARDQSVIESREGEPDVHIGVVGKQWSWDFNYVDEDVWDSGIQAPLGTPQAEDVVPTLYLPVDQTVEVQLNARDVIHSFWVPAFLYKMDMIPGRINRFQVVPTQEGTFKGKCAELCGAYHSQMLFNVKVVPRQEYDQHMSELRAAGQTGLLNNSLNREQLMEGQTVGSEGGN